MQGFLRKEPAQCPRIGHSGVCRNPVSLKFVRYRSCASTMGRRQCHGQHNANRPGLGQFCFFPANDCFSLQQSLTTTALTLVGFSAVLMTGPNERCGRAVRRAILPNSQGGWQGWRKGACRSVDTGAEKRDRAGRCGGKVGQCWWLRCRKKSVHQSPEGVAVGRGYRITDRQCPPVL